MYGSVIRGQTAGNRKKRALKGKMKFFKLSKNLHIEGLDPTLMVFSRYICKYILDFIMC